MLGIGARIRIGMSSTVGPWVQRYRSKRGKGTGNLTGAAVSIRSGSMDRVRLDRRSLRSRARLPIQNILEIPYYSKFEEFFLIVYREARSL